MLLEFVEVIEDWTADLMTRATIWFAMFAWTGGIVVSGQGSARLSRWFWTAGFALYMTHIFFAYGEVYQWSHRVAWEATARDTLETTGMDSGFGLLVNYGFALVLAIDVFRQWREGRRTGARWIDGLVIFMIVNGAIVFASGPVRWFGIALLASISGAFVWRRLRVREMP